MRRILEAAGIDYDQWRALTLAALKIDFRTSSLARGRRHGPAKAVGALVGQFAFYTVTGGLIAAVIWFGRDPFVAAIVVVAYVMFMVGVASLLDHNAAITSPDDYLILGSRPVASRTYFAARVANVLVYTLAMTSAFAYVPLVSFLIRHGTAVGLAAVAAVYAASLATTLAMIVSYTWLMRVVGPARLKRMLSYVQMMVSFVVYGGYFLVAELIGRQAIVTASITKSGWLCLLPPVWFASYVELAAGRWSALETAPAALSLVALAGLVASIGGRLSIDYAGQLGAVMAASASRPAAPGRSRRAIWFTRDEARAVALLIRGQFRNDTKFRMGVLAILPLTIVYIIMGVRDGGLGDPFVRQRGQGLGFVTMAIMMFPTMLRMNLVRSDSYRASWIFFATPVDRARVVRSSKNLLVVAFLLPYLALVGAVLAYFSSSAWHVAVHLLMVGLLSHLVLQVVILIEPELPFSKPLVKGSASTRVFMVMFVVGATAVLLPILGPFIYRNTLATIGAMAALVGGSVVLDRLTRLRIEAATAGLEFEG